MKDVEAQEWENIKETVDVIYKEHEKSFKKCHNFHDFYTMEDLQSSSNSAFNKLLNPKINDKKKEKKIEHLIPFVNQIRNEGIVSFLSRNSVFYCRHESHQNLVMLSLNHFSVLDDVTRQCEGAVLDENDDYNILSFGKNSSFILFFNYFILFYYILFYFILFYFILFYFILFYFILFYFILFFYFFILFLFSK